MDAQPMVQSRDESLPGRTRLYAKRILVVDDEDAIRRLVARVLTRAGYEVESACDAEDAVDTFRNNSRFDLVVADVRMPGISGPRLVSQLRRLDSSVKVLYLTGYADQLFFERVALWEDEAFLDKPFTTKGLLESVSLMLHGSVSAYPRRFFEAPER